MIASEIISNKIQDLLGSKYALFPISHFNKNYTEARMVDGELVREHTSEYGDFRQKKVVGVLTLTTTTRNNVKHFSLNTDYRIQFSVPRNIEHTNASGKRIKAKEINFEADIDNLTNEIIDRELIFENYEEVDEMPKASVHYKDKIYKYVGESVPKYENGTFYKCVEVTGGYIWEKYNIIKGIMTMSEPNYVLSESDGTYNYDIMEVNGAIAISNKGKFGKNYKIEIMINNQYVELDDVNTFTELIDNNGNAISKSGKTKIEQNSATLSWVCTASIDDIETDNLARKEIYKIIHKNIEIINPKQTTDAKKRKLKVRITTPDKDTHIFWALIGIDFNSNANGIGSYNISFVDDNKELESYTLTFRDTTIKPMKFVEGQIIKDLPIVSQAGYEFLGWSLGIDEDDKEIYIRNGQVWNFTENKIVYSVFKPDLLNSRWLFNDELDLTIWESDITKYIDFTTDNGAISCDAIRIPRNDWMVYRTLEGTMIGVYYENAWVYGNDFKIIVITGGEDIEDDDFINWLTQNATRLD